VESFVAPFLHFENGRKYNVITTTIFFEVGFELEQQVVHAFDIIPFAKGDQSRLATNQLGASKASNGIAQVIAAVTRQFGESGHPHGGQVLGLTTLFQIFKSGIIGRKREERRESVETFACERGRLTCARHHTSQESIMANNVF
jgi:hypothetical protein